MKFIGDKIQPLPESMVYFLVAVKVDLLWDLHAGEIIGQNLL